MVLLDAAGGPAAEGAADLLVTAGVVAAMPTAAAGLNDWSDTAGPETQVGLVHAALNTTALSLYLASPVARPGTEARRPGAGPGRARTPVLADTELADGELCRADAGGVPVLLYRTDGTVYALASTCTHMGGPLQEGTISDGCVTCPWPGSTFPVRRWQHRPQRAGRLPRHGHRARRLRALHRHGRLVHHLAAVHPPRHRQLPAAGRPLTKAGSSRREASAPAGLPPHPRKRFRLAVFTARWLWQATGPGGDEIVRLPGAFG
jgi:nitrite reductase/ring-hydroxylating ferredoxin subunit